MKSRLYIRTPFIFREVGVVDVPADVNTVWVPIVKDVVVNSGDAMEVHVWPDGTPKGMEHEELEYSFRYNDPVSGERVFVHEQEI